MKTKNSPPPSKLVQSFPNVAHLEPEDRQPDSTMDVWDPPFERWMKLADDLLREWPIENSPASRV